MKVSPQPDTRMLAEIFTTAMILGGYLATMIVMLFSEASHTIFFLVRKLVAIVNGRAIVGWNNCKLLSVLY